MKTKNLSVICLILVTVVALTFSQWPTAVSAEVTAEDKTINVLADVIGLDMAKCKLELISNSVDNPEIYGGLTREDLTYNLEASENKAQVVCTFVNGTLIRCYIYIHLKV